MNTSTRKILTTLLLRIIIRTIKGNKLKIFKEVEKISFKIIKFKAHSQFNLTCDNNNLLPMYLNLYLYQLAL